MKKTLTVFTPTYNRRKTLIDVYRSLKNQTSKDFIWMIVDDGSTDGTEDVVSSWILENIINIEYFKKENGGKVSAINYSLGKCATELWICLDSDDTLTKDAVAIFIKNYKKIIDNGKVCGMLALRTGTDGKVMNHKNKMPSDIEYSTLNEIRYFHKIDTEYAFILKTKVAQKYKYPLIKGEKFMPLSYVYDQIDQTYVYKIIREDVMISEYIEDGMTKNKKKLILNYPKGYRLYHKQRIVLAPSLKLKIKSIILYIVASILDKDTNFRDCIKDSPEKLYTIILFLPSYILKKIAYR